jgi:hypothetical protein
MTILDGYLNTRCIDLSKSYRDNAQVGCDCTVVAVVVEEQGKHDWATC